ncbi:MFS transporter [Amycolatopsis arida]|uniref:MFS transporter n=1 Tax=Amycolatopsis arida TaxID=587909 RepID=UPI000B8A0145|nr:MFS transporter [Amycolatopsis arida]
MSFLGVLRIREFRALWLAELLSVLGDQLARVALAVLVFQRTDSAALTGLTYALTFVPSLIGGVLLAGWGDRRSRREVMVTADVIRAVLLALMIIPGVPLWVLCILVAAVTLFAGPFKAAQQALLPDVLPGERYMVGMAIRNITSQSVQVVAFAGGGVLVAVVTPTVGLAIDAATFAVSAILIWRGVRWRPTPARVAPLGSGWRSFAAGTAVGARAVWRDPALRTLLALNWLAGFYIVPEALAAPFAASIGAGAAAVGWLMAADPIGSVAGAVVFGRWVPEPVQVRALGLLGIAAGVPLVLCVLRPGLAPAIVLFALSGMLATGYNIQGTVSFVRRLPDDQRAQGCGLNSSGLITVQGLGALAAGVLADLVGPAHAIAVAGAAGALVAVPIAVAWSRAGRGAAPAVVKGAV